MKVLIYTEGQKTISNSGLGKANLHQMMALNNVNIKYTTNLKDKDKVDLIHINFYGLKSYRLAKWANKNNVPLVYHAHSTKEDFIGGFILNKQLAPLFKWWIIKCYTKGDSIITPTIYSKKLLTSYGIKKPIYALSNGVDLTLFKKDEKKRLKFRKRYNLKDDDFIIIGIGLYIERKGIVDFVEVAKKLPNYKFIWFGSSPLKFSTKPAKNAVNTKLDNLSFPGYVSQEEISDALNGCDVFLFPTYEETEGIPIIEALSCNTTSIVRDINIFDDWLEDKVHVYKGKNVNDFINIINDIHDNKIKKLDINKMKEVSNKRDIKEIGKSLKEIYEKTINDKK